jgi:AcrR family transcriptional regulator
MSSKRATKPPDERRRELIEASRELFAQKGYEHASISDIVREAGVAQGTFYWYFDSKRDVLMAIMEEMLEKMTAVMRSVAERHDLTATEKLWHMEDGVMALVEGHTDLVQAFHIRGNAPLHDRVVEKWDPQMLAILASVVRQGVEEKTFRVSHPEAMAAFLLTLLEKYLHFVARESGQPRGELREAIWEFMLGGLGVRDEPKW